MHVPWNCKQLLYFRMEKPSRIPNRIFQRFQSHLLFPKNIFMTSSCFLEKNWEWNSSRILGKFTGNSNQNSIWLRLFKIHWRSNRLSKLKLINQTPQISFTFTIFFLIKENQQLFLFVFSFENSLTLVHFFHGVHWIPFKRILTKFLENSD